MRSFRSLPLIRDAWSKNRRQGDSGSDDVPPTHPTHPTQRFPCSRSNSSLPSSNGSSGQKCIFWLPSKLTSSESSNQEESESSLRNVEQPSSTSALPMRSLISWNEARAKGAWSSEAPSPTIPKLSASSEAGQDSPVASQRLKRGNASNSSSSLGASSTKSAPAMLFGSLRLFRERPSSTSRSLVSPRLFEKRKVSLDQNSTLESKDRNRLLMSCNSSGLKCRVQAFGSSLRVSAFESKVRKIKEQHRNADESLKELKGTCAEVPQIQFPDLRTTAIARVYEPPSTPPLPSALLARSRSPVASRSSDKASSASEVKSDDGSISAEARKLILKIYNELGGAMAREGLKKLAIEGVLASIPRDEHTGELSSVGSIKHAEGTCLPCAYWFKGVCKWSLECRYCHLLHDGQKSKRLRPSKSQRQRRRRRGMLQEEASQGDAADILNGDQSASMADLPDADEDTAANKDELGDQYLYVLEPRVYSF